MERTNRGWGIYRKDPYLSVYNWQRSGVNSYGEEKDKKPKSEVIRGTGLLYAADKDGCRERLA